MKTLLTSIIIISVLAYLGAGLMLFLKQRSFIYFPVKYSAEHPDEILFKNQGESIAVTALNRDQQNAILYFGGNAENVDFNIPDFSHAFPDHALYLVKYRGYGSSTGEPTESGLFSDALLIFDELSRGHSSISVIGRSLGSGIATYVAANRNLNKLVLVTPFDSITSIARKLFPVFPHSLLLLDKYDSLGRAKTITSSSLVIAAELDQVIPRKHTDNLVSEFNPEIIQYEIVPGHGHNDLTGYPGYYELIVNFLYRR